MATPPAPSAKVPASREAGLTTEFLNSKPHGGRWTLWTYGIPKQTTENGTVGLIKVIGTFEKEEDAEAVAKKEMGKQHCKVVRIDPTGTWQDLRDPRVKRRDEYEHWDGKGEIKRIVTQMNVDLHNKENDDEKEMRDDMRKVMEELKVEDKESLDEFMILDTKIRSNPGLVAHYQAEITRMTAEIVRLQELEPAYKERYEQMVAKYPDYPKRVEGMREALAKQGA
jgi:hypothetical protein